MVNKEIVRLKRHLLTDRAFVMFLAGAISHHHLSLALACIFWAASGVFFVVVVVNLVTEMLKEEKEKGN